jgi:hypothetical protein
MIDLELLRVSLTKNGCFKVAELMKAHSRGDVLNHVEGDHSGINIKRSQIANMLDMNPTTGEIPEYWDSIRDHGHYAIDAFTVVAMLFSHYRFIRLMQAASQDRPEFTGYFLRDDLTTKEFTNLAFALGCFGLSEYERGAGAVEYNLKPVAYHLQTVGGLVRDLLTVKLRRAGWRDPVQHRIAPDRDLMTEMQTHQFHRVLSMDWPNFSAWMNGRLRLTASAGAFGLHDVGLFTTPIALPGA